MHTFQNNISFSLCALFVCYVVTTSKNKTKSKEDENMLLSSLQMVDLMFSIFYFSFLFSFCFIFYFLFLEQLELGLIGHTVTTVTT